MMENKLPELLVHLEDAVKQLKEQISLGREIEIIPVKKQSDFRDALDVYYSWNEYNQALLLKFFDNDFFYNEYGEYVVLANRNRSLYENIDRFRNDIRKKLRCLESILNRTERLLENPSEALLISTHGDREKDSLFIAMPMSDEYPELPDVLNAIKVAALECGLKPLRIDDEISKDPITPRVLKKLQTAEYVVADLTHGRPNVYYEAGFAEALGNTPIYIARTGTNIEFDTQDYPVIFFENTEELTESLNKLLTALRKANEQ